MKYISKILSILLLLTSFVSSAQTLPHASRIQKDNIIEYNGHRIEYHVVDTTPKIVYYLNDDGVTDSTYSSGFYFPTIKSIDGTSLTDFYKEEHHSTAEMEYWFEEKEKFIAAFKNVVRQNNIQRKNTFAISIENVIINPQNKILYYDIFYQEKGEQMTLHQNEIDAIYDILDVFMFTYQFGHGRPSVHKEALLYFTSFYQMVF